MHSRQWATIRQSAFLLILLGGVAWAQAQSSDQGYSPLIQRIQIPESCPVTAKWITQMLASGSRLRMVSYEPDLGILTYESLSSASDPDPVSTSDVLKFDKKKDKTVHITGLTFTLRSLVSSTISFQDVPSKTKADACTISAALKFASKTGRVLDSSGLAEKELLETFRSRYAEHGLDY